MKVVILCGGKGTRLREETEFKPKPLVLIGNRPILWHIMKIYSHYGHKDFILCLGYKGEMIKDYFLRLAEMSNDFTLKSNLSNQYTIEHLQNNIEDWNITFVDTGAEAMTGSRVAKIEKYLDGEEDFFLTYGDGLANLDINNLYKFHKFNNKLVTVTGAKLRSFFGIIEPEGSMVKSFTEKPEVDGLINGGFFVCNKNIFDYLSKDDNCILEKEPLQKITAEKQMSLYRHDGFWNAMDTYKQVEELNKIWNGGDAPWAVWLKNKPMNIKEERLIKELDPKPVQSFSQNNAIRSARNQITFYDMSNDRFFSMKENGLQNKNPDLYWKNKNVFVTGCTGFLGSWLVKSLVDKGARVVGLVRDIVPDSNLYKNGYFSKINIVNGELEDQNLLERTLGEYEIDTIFHLGAQTIVGIANRNPISTFESNIRGTYNLLEAARHSPLIKRIVIASSDKAYGDQKELPYNEEMPLIGKHPYDVSKSCVDLIAQAYFKTFNLPVCITRCGNFFGGGDLNFNRIIPDAIRSVLQNKEPVIRSDGTLIRDYFYIEDGVNAYLSLAEKMDQLKIYGEAFNFSNENQLTVLEVAKKLLI